MRERFAKVVRWIGGILGAVGVCVGAYLLPRMTTEERSLPPAQLVHDATATLPAAAQRYVAAIAETLRRDPPIMPLDAGELRSPGARAAQNIALADRRVRMAAYAPDGRTPVRTEVMRIYRVTDVTCSGTCYAFEMYNYFRDATIRAIVDVQSAQVVRVTSYERQHPEISKRLKRIVRAIAAASPAVHRALGRVPRQTEATMANVRTSLRGSLCEEAHHLCVAPTFVDHARARALWVIVDVTDLRVVGVRWTDLGATVLPAAVSLRSIRNAVLMREYCQKDTDLARDGWRLRYRLTPSDGLEIVDVTFRDRPIIRSAKIVDWHVSYAQMPVAHEADASAVTQRDVGSADYPFGYSDAMGCPLFSTSAVLAFNAPVYEEIVRDGVVVGFALVQDFRNPSWPLPCNYRYENRYEFYKNGDVRITGANYGRGCGADGWYRPVFRIAPAVASPLRVQRFADGAWQDMAKEFWFLQPAEHDVADDGAQLIVRNDTAAWRLIPNYGTFGDGMRPDRAYVYVTRARASEGEDDLLAIGSCCNADERQGPEQFVNGEALREDVVVWYVPQIKNDAAPGREYCWAQTRVRDGVRNVATWPCRVGPLIRVEQE